MTLKIMDDRIQLTEDRRATMRQGGGRSTRSETVTFTGREVGESDDIRALALNIRNLNQLRISIPVTSEQYAWIGWCNVLSASATVEEFTKKESSFPGTTVLNWNITFERIDGQQEVRLLGSERPHDGTYVVTPKIGLPDEVEAYFFPGSTANPPASVTKDYDNLTIREWTLSYDMIGSGLRYVLNPEHGHMGQVKITIDDRPVVGLQPVTRFASSWSMTNGMVTLSGLPSATMRIAANEPGGGISNLQFGSLLHPDEVSVIYNTYFMAVLELHFSNTGSRTTIRILMRRGSPILTVHVGGYPALFSSVGWVSTLSGHGYRRITGLGPGMSTLLGWASGAGTSNQQTFHLSQTLGTAVERHSTWLGGLDQWVRMVQL